MVKGKDGQEEMDGTMMVEAQGSQVGDLLPSSCLLNRWVDVCVVSLNIHCNHLGTMKKELLKSGR